MNIRTSAAALGLAIAIGSPLAVLAEGSWENTHDEAGSRIVDPQFGSIHMNAMHPRAMHADTALPAIGDVSAAGQYSCFGEEGGGQIRPMQRLFEGHRMVHHDDPVGHMHRPADHSPFTAPQRAALERSAGR